MATNQLEACVISFVRAVLCGNSVLRSTFKTFLNAQIAEAQLEISLLSAQIARLDILNDFAQLEIQTLNAVQAKAQASLNVIFGPLQPFANCPSINSILTYAESSSTAKALAAVQNAIYTYNRRAYVANALTAEQKQLQSFVSLAQNLVNSIDSICSGS